MKLGQERELRAHAFLIFFSLVKMSQTSRNQTYNASFQIHRQITTCIFRFCVTGTMSQILVPQFRNDNGPKHPSFLHGLSSGASCTTRINGFFFSYVGLPKNLGSNFMDLHAAPWNWILDFQGHRNSVGLKSICSAKNGFSEEMRCVLRMTGSQFSFSWQGNWLSIIFC